MIIFYSTDNSIIRKLELDTLLFYFCNFTCILNYLINCFKAGSFLFLFQNQMTCVTNKDVSRFGLDEKIITKGPSLFWLGVYNMNNYLSGMPSAFTMVSKAIYINTNLFLTC